MIENKEIEMRLNGLFINCFPMAWVLGLSFFSPVQLALFSPVCNLDGAIWAKGLLEKVKMIVLAIKVQAECIAL